MSDEGKPLGPEHIFKKFTWRHIISIGEGMEKFTTWTITGIAAIVALMVGNLDSVSKIVSPTGLQVALTLFVLSLIAGVVSKQCGMALSYGLKMINDLESLLNSESGQNLMDQMKVEPKQLTEELAEPFWWPLSTLMRKAGIKGTVDYLSSDKRLIKLFSIQLYTNFTHIFLGAFALLSLAVFLK